MTNEVSFPKFPKYGYPCLLVRMQRFSIKIRYLFFTIITPFYSTFYKVSWEKYISIYIMFYLSKIYYIEGTKFGNFQMGAKQWFYLQLSYHTYFIDMSYSNINI